MITNFFKAYFKGLSLSPGLFYSWEQSIRFELWAHSNSNEEPCFQQMHERAITLFNRVFAEEDDILFITDVYGSSTFHLNVYPKYIKQRQQLYKLQHSVLKRGSEEDGVTHRYLLPCKKYDIRYTKLLKAIGYKDFRHPSTILKTKPQIGYDLYFVNLSKKMIFHMYDDQGCDVLGSDKETIRFLYEEYRDWLLEYNREEMDRVFKR
ncbi:DUF3885 domain-containing protein [Metabacillus sp. FJAT-52054]|uniref:DUF3885 domain-containing protein n=1 Tax=Metabacillus sediminis TaxID=3117746 RepID=A0ABZ2NK20_9BACI